MKKYLALIRKQDFADLYKYGILHANKDTIREFSCSIEELKNDLNFFNDIKTYANGFDSSFTYIFVYYSKKSNNRRFWDIKIEEVQNIYPLDNEAKTEQEINPFDKRIKIQDPLWPHAIFEFKKSQTYNDCKKGTENIWKIFGLSDKQYKYCKKQIPEFCIKEVIDELYSGKRPVGSELSIWIYLLRYERHAIYPHTTLGYFMDAVHVVVNKMNGSEIDSYEPTYIYQLLNSLVDRDLKSNEIQTIIDSSEEAKGIKNKIKEYCPGIDYLKVATIFLKMKNDYADGLTYCKEIVESYLKAWPNEFPVATYLLGWTLGHRKTSDCLYEILSLAIFKKNMESPEIQKVKPQYTKLKEQSPSKSIKMGKLNKDGSISKRPKPHSITSEQDIEKHLKDGWIPIKE